MCLKGAFPGTPCRIRQIRLTPRSAANPRRFREADAGTRTPDPIITSDLHPGDAGAQEDAFFLQNADFSGEREGLGSLALSSRVAHGLRTVVFIDIRRGRSLLALPG